jgi:ABC-2 type transport system permease protein
MSAPARFVQETAALTRRWFLHTLRQPIAVAAGLFQPLIWLFLFGSLFQNMRMPGMAAMAEGSYIPFLAAGIIVFTAFNSALSSGVPILFDKENSFLDRLLVAPLSSRFSIVCSSALHIFIMSTLQSALVLVVIAAWSPLVVLSPLMVLLVLAITALLILGFTILSIGLAFGLRAHFEMLSLIQVLALPLIFISTAFAPLEAMPGWLQWPASLNPLTAAIEPVRHLLLNHGEWPTGVLVAAPWANLTATGCLMYLVAFNAGSALLVGWFLRRFFR